MEVPKLFQLNSLDLDLPGFDIPDLDPDDLPGFTSSAQDGDYANLMALFPDEQGSPVSGPLHAASDASAAALATGRSGNSLTDSSNASMQLPAGWPEAEAMQQDMPPPSGASTSDGHSDAAAAYAAFRSPFTSEALRGTLLMHQNHQQPAPQHQQQASQFSRPAMVFSSLPQPQQQVRPQHVVTTVTGGPASPPNGQQRTAAWASGAQQQQQQPQQPQMGLRSTSNGNSPSTFGGSFNRNVPQSLPSSMPNGSQPMQQDLQLTYADLLALGSSGSIPVTGSGSWRTTSTSDANGELRTGSGMGLGFSAAAAGVGAGSCGAGAGAGAGAAGGAVKEEPAAPPPSRFKRGRLQAKQRMQDMEREVEEKLRMFKMLSSENEDLKTKSQMLEKVILIRERQISLLKTHGPATEDGDDGVQEQMAFVRRTVPLEAEIRQVSTGASTTCDPPAAQPCTSATTGSGSGTSTEDLCCDAATSSGRAACSVNDDPDAPRAITRKWAESAVPWDRVLSGKPPDGTAPSDPVAPVASSKCDFLTDKECPLGNGNEPFERKLQDASKIIKMLKVMALDEVVLAWKGFVDKCTELLMHMNSRPDDPEARQRLVLCVNRMGFATMNVAVLNPDVMLRFSLYNMEEQRVDNAWENQDHWRHVLEMVELTDQQERQLLQVLSLVGRDLVKNVHQRRRLQIEWQSMMTKHEVPRPGGSGIGKNSCEAGIKQAELVKKATASFRREYNAMLLLHATALDQILTPEQLAKMAVYSWPHFPHIGCISVSLAEQRGMPNLSRTALTAAACNDTKETVAAAVTAVMAGAARVQAAKG